MADGSVTDWSTRTSARSVSGSSPGARGQRPAGDGGDRQARNARCRALPPHAQDIFREAFNHALEEYGREENAFGVAWTAVKKRYRKEGRAWVMKD